MLKVTTTYAVLDLETTGSTYDNGDRIIQIGVAFVQNGQIIDQFAADIFPNQDIPREITKLTGITNDQVKDAPTFDQIAEILWQKLANTVIVAHNIGFDYKFLDQTFEGHGYPTMTQEKIDTVELIRTLYPTAQSYKLGDFCQTHGIDLENAHTAIDDATATAHILIMCQKKIAAMPKELFEQIRPFTHYFIGQTGQYMIEWFDSAENQQTDFEYIAPFVLNPRLSNFQIFPDQFGFKQTEYLDLTSDRPLEHSGGKVIMANNGIRLSPLQVAMIKKIEPFFQGDITTDASTSKGRYAFLTANAGVGKSLAYMVSALSALDKIEKQTSNRVVISTSTVILQHQYLEKTMKLASNLLGKPLKVVVLKGQNHYIQLTRFQKMLTQLKQRPEMTLKRDVLISVALLVWLSETETGDLHELNSGLNNQAFWQSVERMTKGSHHEEIQRWADYAFYERQVKEAENADVVILNHAYFVYHYQELIAQSVLTEADKLVIDECHQLPVTVHQQKTRSIQSKEVEERLNAMDRLIQRLMDKVVSNNVKINAVDKLFHIEKNLQLAWSSFDHFIDQITDQYQTKAYYQRKTRQSSFYIAHDYYMVAGWREDIRKVFIAMNKMIEPLKVIARQLYQMEILSKRAYQQILGQIFQFSYHIAIWFEASEANASYYAELFVHFGKQSVQVEIDRKLYSTQESLSEIFQAIPSQVLLVSASLEIVGAKEMISNSFGVEDFEWYSFMDDSYEQQFNANQNGQINGYYLKDYLSIDKYNETDAAIVIADVVESLWQQKGDVRKIQVFFQSQSLMQASQHELKNRLSRADFGQLIVQNHQRNLDRMARQYEESQRAILFALASFQEGIHLNTKTDVFILTRLPFQAPDKPDELAKQDYLKSIGDNYFDDVALPDMLMNLTQIFGRMATSVNEKTIFISLDHRLEKAAYADHVKEIMPEALTMNAISMAQLKNKD